MSHGAPGRRPEPLGQLLRGATTVRRPNFLSKTKTTDGATETSTRRKSHYSTPVEDEELEFIQAIEDFKKANGQPFPSWSEVLQVLKGLGYSK